MKKAYMIAGGLSALLIIGYGGKTVIDLKNASEIEKTLAPYIADTEKKHGLPDGLLHRLLKQESHFRKDIITGKTRSSVGAVGIAQFMPATAKEYLGSVEAALDPIKAIDAAARYVKWLYGYVGKDWKKAVAAYNWGVGNVTKFYAGTLKTKSGVIVKNMPTETQKYIKAIIV
jgi:soluble lytic murein transglycosylase-like protein